MVCIYLCMSHVVFIDDLIKLLSHNIPLLNLILGLSKVQSEKRSVGMYNKIMASSVDLWPWGRHCKVVTVRRRRIKNMNIDTKPKTIHRHHRLNTLFLLVWVWIPMTAGTERSKRCWCLVMTVLDFLYPYRDWNDRRQCLVLKLFRGSGQDIKCIPIGYINLWLIGSIYTL